LPIFGNINVVELLIRVPVVLLALTVHEFCHAYFAYRMGDPTAARLGRLSLNPLRHLDPLGTICLMFAPIGWAKPVPVNPLNFHDRRKGELVCTAAGPGSNLVQAIVFGLIIRAVIHFGQDSLDNPVVHALLMVSLAGVLINTGLAVFNCLPLYPLDGFHITLNLLKPPGQQQFEETMRFGPFVIIGLVMLGNLAKVPILTTLIRPPTSFILRFVAGLPYEFINDLL
jgi:Zn-dependent protease